MEKRRGNRERAEARRGEPRQQRKRQMADEGHSKGDPGSVSVWMDGSGSVARTGRREVPREFIDKMGGLARFLEANPRCEEYTGQDVV